MLNKKAGKGGTIIIIDDAGTVVSNHNNGIIDITNVLRFKKVKNCPQRFC